MGWFSPSAFPVVTDVHGNADGLRQVLAAAADLDLSRPPLFLGDLFWTSIAKREPREVLELLLQTPVFGIVRGNTEELLMNGHLERWQPTDEENLREKEKMTTFKVSLSESERQFIANLPARFDFTFAGRRCRAVHASPTSAENGLNLDCPRDVWMTRMGHAEDIDVLISGHLHRSFTHLTQCIVHVAVGAVGRSPRDFDGIIDFAVLDATPSGLAVVHERLMQRNGDSLPSIDSIRR
jgi:predicted phosphodiesterase